MKRFNLAMLVVLLVALAFGVITHRPQSTEAKVWTGDQALMKMLYGHQAFDYFAFSRAAGDTTATGTFRDSAYAFIFYSPDSSATWNEPATEVLVYVTKACTLNIYGDDNYFIDKADMVLWDAATLTIKARVDSIRCRPTAVGDYRFWAFGD